MSLEELARSSGVLVALDTPLGTEVGLDSYAFTTGPRFQGIKLIPPGWHLLYSAVPGGSGQRSCLWLEVPQGGCVHVARWDGQEAAFALVLSTHGAHPGAAGAGDAGAHQAAAAAAALALDAGLGPYPLHHAPAWRALTSRLCAPLLARLLPLPLAGAAAGGSAGGGRAPGAGGDSEGGSPGCSGDGTGSSCSGGPRPALAAVPPPPPRAMGSGGSGGGSSSSSSSTGAGAGSPSPRASPSAAQLLPSFVRLPGVGPGSLPADRTAHAMDTSACLRSALQQAGSSGLGGWPGVLGELQAAFVWCLAGQSFAALEHWKALLDCLLRAEDALLAAAASAGQGAAAGPLQVEGWVEALGSVLPAQLKALQGEEGLALAEGVLSRGMAALARTAALLEGRSSSSSSSSGALRAAMGTALQAAVQSGVVDEGVVGGLAQRLLGRSANAGGAGATGAAPQASAATEGFATLAELLQHLELEGEGELPAVVFEEEQQGEEAE